MTFESLTRDSFWWRGAWDDNLNYSMTAQEWCAIGAAGHELPPTQIRLVEITDDNHLTYASGRGAQVAEPVRRERP